MTALDELLKEAEIHNGIHHVSCDVVRDGSDCDCGKETGRANNESQESGWNVSGGSYDYLSYKIEDMAEAIPDNYNPKRTAFKKLLKLVAQACHDIEYVDSSDYGPGDEDKAIDKCLAARVADRETLAKAAAYDELSKWFDAKKKAGGQ